MPFLPAIFLGMVNIPPVKNGDLGQWFIIVLPTLTSYSLVELVRYPTISPIDYAGLIPTIPSP